jgi:hypothetical protein
VPRFYDQSKSLAWITAEDAGSAIEAVARLVD